jgi:hypothetical protein
MKTIIALLLWCVPFNVMNGTPDGTFVLCRIEPITIEEQIMSILIDSGYTINEQKIIIAQAKLESGNFSSPLYRKSNNAFAIHKWKDSKYALETRIRAEGCACFASYRNVREATLDYLDYRKYKSVPREESPQRYVAYIKSKNYFTAPESEYLSILRLIIQRDNTLINQFNERYSKFQVCRTGGS